jgi:NAD+ diphosphatase
MALAQLQLSRSAVDRRADERADPRVLVRAWADERTRVLRWSDGLTPVVPGDGPVRLDLVPPSAVAARPGSRLVVLLGRDDAGVLHLAAEVEAPEGGAAAAGWQDLRALGTVLDDREAGLLTQATAVLRWHLVHPRCPRCGEPTEVVQAGWVRRCPRDGSDHFPRTDPAVIMAVVDDDDRILLGHDPAWPLGRYSTLAGFVEPGESLEAAVRREVLEEVGVAVGEVTYLGNQPWPFPASLMLGFTARAVDTAVRTDDVEITDARWFTREQLLAAATSGEVVLPGGISIASRLVEHWYGGPLPAPGAWR